MKRRRRLLTVSAILLLIAVVDFVVLQQLGDPEPGLIRGWRLFLSALLSIFLALGNNAARWITIVLTGLGALGGFVAVAILVVSGGLGPGAAPLLVWFGLVTAAYAIICAFLTFSAGVRREIRRASGQM